MSNFWRGILRRVIVAIVEMVLDCLEKKRQEKESERR